jgi:multiple sugar transport system substrate-binding protein
MKVGDYNNSIIAGQQTTRRRLLQGAAGLGAAAMGGASFGAFSPARAQGTMSADEMALRKEILKVPGVGKGSPTDSDWQKVGELCLGPTKARVKPGEFKGVQLTEQSEPARLPVSRLPQTLGDLYRREDRLDRCLPGRL